MARSPFGVPNRNARLARAELIRLDADLADLALLVRQVIEAAHQLAGDEVNAAQRPTWIAYRPRPDHSGAHEVVAPLLGVAETAMRTLDWPTGTADYVARVAPGAEAQTIWQLPEDLKPQPGRARRPAARRRSGRRGDDCALTSAACGALSAGRRDRAHRSRPYRSRLAVAAGRDAAKGAPHLPHRRRPDGSLSRIPLQPVDGAALCLPRGGRSGAPRARQGEGRRRPVGTDRRDVGRAGHQHADRRVAGPPTPLRHALFRPDVRHAAAG